MNKTKKREIHQMLDLFAEDLKKLDKATETLGTQISPILNTVSTDKKRTKLLPADDSSAISKRITSLRDYVNYIHVFILELTDRSQV